MDTQSRAVRAAPRQRVVAIDAGTYGFGYATAVSQGANMSPVTMFEHWPDAAQPSAKTRSAILYRGRSPVAWGWTAEKQYAELLPEEAQSHSLFTDFKLALESEAHAGPIRAAGLTPEQVMADYMRLFANSVKQQLEADGVSPAELDNIQWCLTVPAMWTEASKQAMRRAAVRAGIIRNVESDALATILEPEAAALHARNSDFPPLQRGMTVCLLDVGGGTCDITVHDVEERGGQTVLAEAVAAHGELCGSVYVDEAFKRKYRERVGAQAFDAWSAAHPAEWRQVMSRWMAVKHNWRGPAAAVAQHAADNEADDAADDAVQLHRLLIPPHLHSQLTPQDRAVLVTEQGDDADVLLSEEDLEELFDTSINLIIHAATTQLQQLRGPCSVVVLVGGFAQSPYLQSRVQQALIGGRLAQQVVVPPFPDTAVLQGGVVFGCSPELIRARRARMAYGIRLSAPWEDGAPPSSKFWHEEEGCFFTDSVYDRLVDKGQQVERDEEVLHIVVPLHRHQPQAAIEFYTTDNPDTRFIVEGDGSMRRLGELLVDLPQPGPSQMDGNEDDDASALPHVVVRLRFGHTELTATAQEEATGVEAHARFRFASVR